MTELRHCVPPSDPITLLHGREMALLVMRHNLKSINQRSLSHCRNCLPPDVAHNHLPVQACAGGMEKTPKIVLQLNLQGEGSAHPREVVKRVTNGELGKCEQCFMLLPSSQSRFNAHTAHEVVEVNGFTFKRPRASVPAMPPENQPPNNPAAASLSQPQQQQQQQQQHPCLSVAGPLAGTANPATAASALATLCAHAVAAEAAAVPGNGALAAALARVAETFGALVGEAARSGSIQAGLPQAAAGTLRADGSGALTPRRRSSQSEVESEPDTAADLAARKAGLRARLAAFDKASGLPARAWRGDGGVSR